MTASEHKNTEILVGLDGQAPLSQDHNTNRERRRRDAGKSLHANSRKANIDGGLACGNNISKNFALDTERKIMDSCEPTMASWPRSIIQSE
jgi:hypothetical protein